MHLTVSKPLCLMAPLRVGLIGFSFHLPAPKPHMPRTSSSQRRWPSRGSPGWSSCHSFAAAKAATMALRTSTISNTGMPCCPASLAKMLIPAHHAAISQDALAFKMEVDASCKGHVPAFHAIGCSNAAYRIGHMRRPSATSSGSLRLLLEASRAGRACWQRRSGRQSAPPPGCALSELEATWVDAKGSSEHGVIWERGCRRASLT